MIKKSASKGAGQGASKSDSRSTKKTVKKSTARTAAKGTNKQNTAKQNAAKKSTAKSVSKRAGKKPAAASPSSAAGPVMPDRHEIERRAYALYAARHHADGNDVEDWLEAERQLRDEALAAMTAAARATTTVPGTAPAAQGRRRSADGSRATRTTDAAGTGARRSRKT